MDKEVDNKELYNKIVYPVVNTFLDGVNGTIMVYGPTGAGKTYTMIGDEKRREELRCYHKSPENDYNLDSNGVLLYSMKHIMEKISKETKVKCTNILKCSYIEIYNDSIFDLLQEKSKIHNQLSIIESDSKEFIIKDVIEYTINKPHDFFEAIRTGERKFRY